MSEYTKTPVELLTDLLATMTARAMEAERQRDKAMERGDRFYEYWQGETARRVEAEEKLAAKESEHVALTENLREYMDRLAEESGDD